MVSEVAEAHAGAPTSAASEWRRGGKVVLGAHLAMATGSSLSFYTSSLFVVPLASQFGWSRSEIAAGAAVGVLGSFAAPLIGGAADRYGAKPVALLFAVLTAIMVIALSQLSGSHAQYMLISGLFGVVAPGCSGLVYSRAVSGWFVRSRGRALGVMAAGASTGALIFSPMIAWSIAQHGFSGGYLALAAILVCLGIPAITWGLEDRKGGESNVVLASEADRAPLEGVKEALWDILRSRSFIALALTVLALNAPSAGVLTQLDPLLAQNNVAAPALLIALFAVAVLVGRVGIGWLFDSFDARLVAALFTLAGVLGCILLTTGMPLAAVVLAVALVGFLQGMETDIIGYFVARHFDRSQFGMVFGLLFTISMIGMGVGVVGFGKLYDATRSYDQALHMAAGFLTVAVLLFYMIPKRATQPDPEATARLVERRSNNRSS
jgi:MFS family permease